MKTSKLLITSLLAAAAMGTNAFGALLETITADPGSSVTKTITSGDEIKLNFGSSGVSVTCAFELSGEDGTFTIGAPRGWKTYILEGAITGSGTLTLKGGTVAGYAFGWALANDMSGFSGKIKLENSDGGINQLKLRGNNGSSFANIEVDLNKYGSTQRNILLVETTATIKGISGTSTDAYVLSNGAQTLTLNTAGSDFSFSGAVGTGVQFATDSSSAPNTNAGTLSLVKSGTGTQTLSGTTYLGNLEVSGGNLVLSGTANIAGTTTVSGGTLDLSGGTITLASSAISVGDGASVTVSSSTVFVLTDALKASGSENTWTLISGTGTVNGWNASTLNTEDNFRKADGSYFGGRSELDFSTAGTVTITEIAACDLYWKGGPTGTWDKNTASNFGKDSTTGADTKFVAGDNVTFSSSATVAVSRDGIRAGVVSITGTVDAPTTLTLTNQANLTAKSINIASGTKLDLGSFENGVNVVHHLTGSGEISFQKTGDNHNHRIDLGTEFTGTINYGGTLNPTNAILGAAAARVNFTNVDFWSKDGSATLAQTLNFSGESNRTRGGTLTLTGPISFSENSLFKVEAGRLNISGSVTDASITQTGGTLNISLSSNSTVKSLTQTSGTFEIVGASDMSLEFTGTSTIKSFTVKSDRTGYNRTISVENGASVSVEGDFLLRNEYNNTSTLNVEGTVSVGGNFWIARDGRGIVNINDGGTVVANTLTFGQHWDDSTGTNKTSQVNVATGGKLIAGSIVANTNLNDSNKTSILASSTLNLNGGTLGTSADSMTIDVTSGNTALSVKLGAGTTSTINTGKYDTATKTFTATGAAISIANVISGDGALKKSGAGMLTLSNANTYKGGTVIEAGTVVAAHANALGTTKGVEVQSGATLNLGTSAVTVAGLSGAGTVGLADGTTSSTLTVDSASDSTFSGSISGDMSVVKTGAGTQEFSGVFTLLGESDNAKSVSVQEGMLKLHLDTGSTPLVGSISVSSGSSLGVVASSNSPYGVAATTDNGYTYDGSISFDVGGKLIVDLNSVAVVDGATEIALKILSSSAISFAGTDLASMTLTDATLGGFVEFIDTNGVFNEFQKSWVYETDGLNIKTLSLTMTIPEPSVFGLLAGLGALALAGTRRRRKKA